MLLIARYSLLLSLIALQSWVSHSVKAQENHMTRHGSHNGHDQNRMRWDEWTAWSACSVDCGRGVTSRSRNCRSMLDGLATEGCSGRSDEIKICEFTGCIKEAEDQAECKKLESQVFGGKRYRWKPYTHPRDECKLACRPIGGGFYLEVGKNVSDGSLCSKTKKNICIGGKCKVVGCDNIVESGTSLDGCGVCGGDSSTCSRVSKTFTDSVKSGYRTITTIPRGATKISIAEGVGGRNYLGVSATDKSFSINTDFRLSRFGNLPGAGTVFKYTRHSGPDCPDECIHAEGPIDVPVDIIVLFYAGNSGIKYSYNIPSGAAEYTEKKGNQALVHIGGGTLGDEDTRVKGDRKRPMFSSDFKFKKNDRSRKHRQHRKHNRNRENDNKKANSINITGETGALQRHKTKTQRIVAKENENSFKITYKNDTIFVETSRTDINRNVHDNNQGRVAVNTTPSNTNQYDHTDSFIEQKVKETPAQTNENDHSGIVEDDFDADVADVADGKDGEEDRDDDDEVDQDVEDDAVDEVGEVDEDDNNESDEIEDNVDTLQESPTKSPSPNASVTDGDMYTNDNRAPSLYSWLISGYTECSQTCGKGKQSPILECIVTDKQARVDGSYCSDLKRPSTAVLECSNGECPPSWTARTWNKCSVTCGLGTHSRDYICLGPNGEQISEGECDSPKPDREEQTCDLGSCAVGWYYSEWEKECTGHCGYGTLSRRVHCSSDSGNINTACNQLDKPEQSKSCRNTDCGGFWVTGPWSKCNATCGMASQSRPVACAQKHRDRVSIVTEGACKDEERPQTSMSCELEPCKPQWYMTDWGDCAVSCGAGQRSRDVRCLDDNFNASSDCDKDSKPSDQERCESNRPCPLSDESRDKPDVPEQTPKAETPNKPDEIVIPEDCQDKFQQCKMVLKARLCQYGYYKKICCRSCTLNEKS